jgi:hypothetical protein
VFIDRVAAVGCESASHFKVPCQQVHGGCELIDSARLYQKTISAVFNQVGGAARYPGRDNWQTACHCLVDH